MEMSDGILSSREIQKLVMNLLVSRAPKTVGEAEMQSLANWAAGVRLEAAALNLMLRGDLLVERCTKSGGPRMLAAEKDPERQARLAKAIKDIDES